MLVEAPVTPDRTPAIRRYSVTPSQPGCPRARRAGLRHLIQRLNRLAARELVPVRVRERRVTEQFDSQRDAT